VRQEAIVWLDNFNITVDLHNWSNAQIVRRHLIGFARNWLLSYVESIKTWKDFEQKFTSTFVRKFKPMHKVKVKQLMLMYIVK